MSRSSEDKAAVVRALALSKRRWRTARGLAKEAGVDISRVEAILESSPEFIRSKKSGSNGQPLYALREKRNVGANPTGDNSGAIADPGEAFHPGSYLILLPFDASSARLRDAVARALRGIRAEPVFLAEPRLGAARVDEIVKLVRASDGVIADVSRQNPNVMFELGIAHAMGKPLILLLSEQATASLPSDLAGYHYFTFDPQELSGFVVRLERVLKQLAARKGHAP